MIKRIFLAAVAISLVTAVSASASVILATASMNSTLCGPNLADFKGHHNARIVVLSANDMNKSFILTAAMERDLFLFDDTVSSCSLVGVAGDTDVHYCETTYTGRCTSTTVRARSTGKINEFPNPDRHEAVSNWHNRNHCEFEY